MAYDSVENNKFTPEDFASIEVIDEWWPKYTIGTKDADGYTPLGAAILNSAPLECIAHIMELYTFNNHKTNNDLDHLYIDIENDISKGRSPIGVACLAMNADAVDVLRSQYYEYILKDEDGNPIPKLDHYGDPINAEKYVMYTSVPLWNDYTKEEYKYNKIQKLSEKYENIPLKYKACEDTDADWLAAAALPKADILIKLIPKATSDADKRNLNSIRDDNGNTLILLACVADCHESVVHIRDNCSNFNDINNIDSNGNSDQIFIKNGDDLTAFDVALESPDTDLLPLLLAGQVNDDFINNLLAKYFHEKANKKINKILIALVTTEKIYNYYINEYEWGDPAEDTKYVIKYIEDENKTSLFNLLLQKYNDPSDADPPIYKEHLTNFFEKMCKHIIAFLYRKSYIPFNENTPTENLNKLLNFYQDTGDASTLYAEIVKLLYDSHDISLQLICDISDNEKRNICIDKIFTGEYNKQLFIQLLKIISNNTNNILDQYIGILTHLYNDTHYFTLNNIAALSGDHDLGEDKDELLFNIIYKLVVSDIATISSGINNTYNTFKLNYCIYLYTDKDLEIQYIVDPEYDVTFKCNIINTLYNNGNLKLDDIYYIYNNYNDNTLYGLHQDLRPLIGCMKYCENDSITSDFFWAYDFANHVSANWHSPQNSYVDIPPIRDNTLVYISSSPHRYKQVKIVDATGSVTPRTPNQFRFDVYNYKPEFEINSAYNVTSDNNAMIVAFGPDINNINDKISNNIPIQSDSNELYTIVEDTYYLGEPVKTINWFTNHSLYAAFTALENQKCYSKKSNELPVIDSLEFKKGTYQGNITLPPKVTAIEGTHWNLPSVTGGKYIDTNTGIKYEPTGWKIGSDSRSFGYDYIFNETDATAQLEFTEAAVTLTYTKPAELTLYNSSGNAVSWPSTVTRDSGTTITLATLSNTYYNADRTKTYTLTGWKIGPTNYSFGATYNLKDNTTAALQYTEVGIVCSVSSETITEGAHFTRTFKLSHQPVAGATVTLNISSTISSRLYIGNSVSSTTNSITLTFTASNWNNEQTVYFIAQDDNNVNGNALGTVSIQSSSTGDNRYSGLTRSFSVTVNDNDSAVVEYIGTPAFESGSFAIKFIDNDYEYQAWTEERNIVKIKDQWDNAYRNGYYVQHIPKSPYWSTSNKVFNYDLLYDDNLDD